MQRADLGRALALLGARLRGDAEGEQALLGDGSEDRSLVMGLLAVLEITFDQAMRRGGGSREMAAEMTVQVLRDLLADGTIR